jgi:hypothetical protein
MLYVSYKREDICWKILDIFKCNNITLTYLIYCTRKLCVLCINIMYSGRLYVRIKICIVEADLSSHLTFLYNFRIPFEEHFFS